MSLFGLSVLRGSWCLIDMNTRIEVGHCCSDGGFACCEPGQIETSILESSIREVREMEWICRPGLERLNSNLTHKSSKRGEVRNPLLRLLCMLI